MKTIKTTILLLIVLFVIGFTLFSSSPVYAGSKIQFIPSTTIPGSDFVANKPIDIESDSLGKYIIAIYNYGIGLVSVLAVVMIMYGGFRWIFAAGNASRIGEAKSTIISALVGLILALGSWMLLNTINPALTSFKPLYTPKPKVASCPWHVNSCDAVNQFFYYIQNETVTNEDSALKEAIEYYSKKFNIEPLQGDYSSERQSEIQRKICENQEGVLASCSIPGGVCVYNEDNATSPCLSIAQIACHGVDAVCSSHPGFDKAFCQDLDQYCSLGVRGSKCVRDDECTNGDGLTCLDNRCFSLGVEGESCDENDECVSGLVCSDDDDDLITPDKCIPGVVECTTPSDCFDANYAEDPGWTTIGAFCRSYNITEGVCDCDDDGDCDVGYRCVDVKSDVVDRDVCLPSSYR